MKLTEIAREMITEATAYPNTPARRRLQRGLRLTLIFKVGQWQLSLTRVGVYPSDEEVKICLAAFGAPSGAEREKAEVPIPGHPQAGCVIRLRWAAQAQFDFGEAGQAVATVHHYQQGR